MEKFELELLDPLFYNSSLDSGAAGSNTTEPWIGDLALDYSINFALGLKKTKFQYTSHKPNYSEIKNFGFITSIGYPETRIKKTRIYDFATSFISDGYVNAGIVTKSQRAPFRNWIKRQGLEPGNKFYFYTFYNNDNIKLPNSFTIRLGNMKSCLCSCHKIPVLENDKLWMNLYTTNLINEIEPNSFDKSFIYYFSDRYIIKTEETPEHWKSILKEYW